jgi:hypothetical protein
VRSILIAAILLVAALGVFAQAPEPIQSGIEEVFLARDNGKGEPGDVVKSFTTKDIPIHCVIQLDSLNPVAVAMNFIAVSVPGVKRETKVFSTSYKTNGQQSRVSFTGKPDKVWVPGSYRIDILIDGLAARSIEFEIEKPPKNLVADPNSAIKPKSTTARRFRKN